MVYFCLNVDWNRQLVMTLEAKSTHIVKGSFPVHRVMRSHTGRTMTMGKGSVY